MPTVTGEGELRLLGAYETWADWPDERRLDGLLPVPPASTHEFCARCWGQGRIISPAPNGEGPIPTPRVTCDATGRVRAASRG